VSPSQIWVFAYLPTLYGIERLTHAFRLSETVSPAAVRLSSFSFMLLLETLLFPMKSVFWQSGEGAAELLDASLELLLNKLSYSAFV